MKSLCLAALLAASMLLAFPAAAQQAGIVTAPVTGQAVQGVVVATGTSDVDGFQSAEVSFAYQDDPTGTWFLLQRSDAPVFSDTLAVWDTTAITDGLYSLRLRIVLVDGTALDTTVTGLRVRNYTPMETPPPDASVHASPGLLPLAAPTDQPGPTPLPSNPAEVTSESAHRAMGRGALVILLLFIIFGAFIRLRRR
jgi:hypothetical protein